MESLNPKAMCDEFKFEANTGAILEIAYHVPNAIHIAATGLTKEQFGELLDDVKDTAGAFFIRNDFANGLDLGMGHA